MRSCPKCGNEFRDGDDVVEISGIFFHPDCVEAEYRPGDSTERRHARTVREASKVLYVLASYQKPPS